MCKSLLVLAVLGVMSGPAAAQATAEPQAPTAAVAKPAMVKKVVCRRIDDEETTGSRLGSAPKVCKTIEVPARGSANGDRAPADRGDERG